MTHEVIVPERRHLFDAALDSALRAEGVGRVTGGGTFLVPQPSGIWTNIEVTVTDLESIPYADKRSVWGLMLSAIS